MLEERAQLGFDEQREIRAVRQPGEKLVHPQVRVVVHVASGALPAAKKQGRRRFLYRDAQRPRGRLTARPCDERDGLGALLRRQPVTGCANDGFEHCGERALSRYREHDDDLAATEAGERCASTLFCSRAQGVGGHDARLEAVGLVRCPADERHRRLEVVEGLGHQYDEAPFGQVRAQAASSVHEVDARRVLIAHDLLDQCAASTLDEPSAVGVREQREGNRRRDAVDGQLCGRARSNDVEPAPVLLPDPEVRPQALRITALPLHAAGSDMFVLHAGVLGPRRHRHGRPRLSRLFPSGVHDLMGGVLEDDDGVQRAGDIAQDPVEVGTGQQEPSQLRSHLLCLRERLLLAADDGSVNGLGDLDEGDLTMQSDQRQAAPLCRVDHMARQLDESVPQLDYEPGDADIGNGVHEVLLQLAAVGNAHSDGEQQLSAEEQVRDLRILCDVHPTHGTIQARAPRLHLGKSPLDRRQIEHLSDRDDAHCQTLATLVRLETPARQSARYRRGAEVLRSRKGCTRAPAAKAPWGARTMSIRERSHADISRPVASTALRRDALGRVEAIATSLACIGPAIGSIFLISSIASGVGPAIGLAILIGAIGFLFHINSVAEFNKHIPSAGGYTTYAARVFGPRVGAMTGAMYLIAGLGIGLALILQVGIFVSDAITGIFSFSLPWWVSSLILGLGIFFVLVRGIRISIRVAATLFLYEVVTVLVSAIVMMAVNHRYVSSAAFDPSQIHKGVVGIGAAFVLSIFMFTGASSPAPLAEETTKPRRNLPSALLVATVAAAVIYLFVSWALVTAFHDKAGPILSTNLPFLVGAEHAFRPLGDLLYVAGSTGACAVLIGDMNSYSRAFFNQAREGILPKWLATVHPTWKTPWVMLAALFTVCLGGGLLLGGLLGALTAFNYLATIGTLAFVLLYIEINVALPFFVLRQRRDKYSSVRHMVLPILGVLALLYPLWEIAKPSQPYPYNWFGLIGIGFLIFCFVFGNVLVSSKHRAGALDIGATLADVPEGDQR